MTPLNTGSSLVAMALASLAVVTCAGLLPVQGLAQPAIAPMITDALPALSDKPAPQAAASSEERLTEHAPAGGRRCRLTKPLFGGSTARVTCYATAAFEPRRSVAGEESAMLGDPTMDHDDEILEELDVPDGVRDASEAVEVMRAWIADGALHVIFDPETFRHDVSEWGRLLGDVAQHISNAVELDGQMSRHEALARIQDAIDSSVNANTVTMEGKIKGRTEH